MSRAMPRRIPYAEGHAQAGYSSLMGAIRGKMDLPGDVRELLVSFH